MLGLPAKASKSEIKKQFYKLSKLYHPDLALHENDAAWRKSKFAEISEAYTILSDDKLRQEYDSKNQQYQPYGRTNYGQWNREKSHHWNVHYEDYRPSGFHRADFYRQYETRWTNVHNRPNARDYEHQMAEKYKRKRSEEFKIFRNRVIVIGMGMALYLLLRQHD